MSNRLEYSIYPFLTFGGVAEEALNFYVNTFPNSEVKEITYIREGQRGEVGKVLNALFEIKGQLFYAMDMEKEYLPQGPLNWAISLFVSCVDEAEFDHIFYALAATGTVVMGPEPIYNLRKVSWVTDKYGFTWQLVWA